LIGLATAIPRILFYFVFAPLLGGAGAALSYMLGAIFGLVVSLAISSRIGTAMHWKETTLMTAIPLMFALLLSTLKVNYVLGIILSIIFSYLLFLKLKLIDRNDV
jgi:hypothetical protein